MAPSPVPQTAVRCSTTCQILTVCHGWSPPGLAEMCGCFLGVGPSQTTAVSAKSLAHKPSEAPVRPVIPGAPGSGQPTQLTIEYETIMTTPPLRLRDPT